MGDHAGTHETKNIDTPVPPRPAKAPAAGNMIIPSERKEASALANVIAKYVRTRDAVKDIEQRAQEYSRQRLNSSDSRVLHITGSDVRSTGAAQNGNNATSAIRNVCLGDRELTVAVMGRL